MNRTHYTVTPPSDNGFDLQPVPKSRRQASRKDETTLSSAGPHTENPKILVSTVWAGNSCGGDLKINAWSQYF